MALVEKAICRHVRTDSASSSATEDGPLTDNTSSDLLDRALGSDGDQLVGDQLVELMKKLPAFKKSLENTPQVRSRFLHLLTDGAEVRRDTDKFLEGRAVGFWSMNEDLNKQHRKKYREMARDSRMRPTEDACFKQFANFFRDHSQRAVLVLQAIFAVAAQRLISTAVERAAILLCTFAVLRQDSWPDVFYFRRLVKKLREDQDWTTADFAFCVSVMADSIQLDEQNIKKVLLHLEQSV